MVIYRVCLYVTMDKGRASEMTQTNIQTDRKSRQRYKRERETDRQQERLGEKDGTRKQRNKKTK